MSAFCFFLVQFGKTNFFIWMTDMYPHNKKTMLALRATAPRAILAVTGSMLACLLCVSRIWAAVPVEEAEPYTLEAPQDEQTETRFSGTIETPRIGRDESKSDSGGGDFRSLFAEFVRMREEIAVLRGEIEQQGYAIRVLQQDVKEQYLDLDSRLLAMSSSAVSEGDDPTVGTAPAPSSPATEKEVYDVAFSQLRERDFESSMKGFERLIREWPTGQFVPNAWYWIGELHLASGDDIRIEDARQAFKRVVSNFADHGKVPDAMYKLGVVNGLLQDTEIARSWFERVINEHPDSGAAELAEKGLSGL